LLVACGGGGGGNVPFVLPPPSEVQVAPADEPTTAQQKVSAVIKRLEGKVVLQSGDGEDL